jgi:hypothetical protein
MTGSAKQSILPSSVSRERKMYRDFDQWKVQVLAQVDRIDPAIGDAF